MTPTLGTRPVSSVGLATNWRLSTIDNQTHPDWSFDRQRFLYGRLSICFSSCIFHSCIFHHCCLLLLFPLLHIPPMRSTPASSTPAISTPAVFSCSFHSCIFHSRIFSAPKFWWTPTLSLKQLIVSGAVNLVYQSSVTVDPSQFMTVTVDISGREARRRAGLSAAAETCWMLCTYGTHIL